MRVYDCVLPTTTLHCGRYIKHKAPGWQLAYHLLEIVGLGFIRSVWLPMGMQATPEKGPVHFMF